MAQTQSFGSQLKEAAKGFALFSALLSLFLTPFLSCVVLFHVLAELLMEPRLFLIGVVVGFIATIFSVLKFKKLMKYYNLKLWN